MKIAPFAVEEWMNQYETQASCNIAETCVDSISLEQLLALLVGEFGVNKLDLVPELLEFYGVRLLRERCVRVDEFKVPVRRGHRPRHAGEISSLAEVPVQKPGPFFCHRRIWTRKFRLRK